MYYIIRDDNTLYQVPTYEWSDKSNAVPSEIVLSRIFLCPFASWFYIDEFVSCMRKIQHEQLKIDRLEFLRYMGIIRNNAIFPLGLQLLTIAETGMIGSWIYPDIEFVYNR